MLDVRFSRVMDYSLLGKREGEKKKKKKKKKEKKRGKHTSVLH